MWQPIETAPKDEDVMIVGLSGKIGAIACLWDEDFGRWLSFNGMWEREFGKPFEPKFWMPLPDGHLAT